MKNKHYSGYRKWVGEEIGKIEKGSNGYSSKNHTARKYWHAYEGQHVIINFIFLLLFSFSLQRNDGEVQNANIT